MRSLGLNSFRKQPRVSPTDQFESLWSMLEAFRLTALTALIESKSRQEALCAGWSALQRLAAARANHSRLASRFRALGGLQGLALSISTKFRAELLLGIQNLRFGRRAWEVQEERRRKAAVLIWNRWYTNMTSSVLGALVQHKNEVKKKLKQLFRGLLLSIKGRMRDGLTQLIQHKSGKHLRDSLEKRKTDVVLQIFRAQKSKAFHVLTALATGKMEFELEEGKKERERLVYAVPDLEELDRNHKLELSETLLNATKAAAIRRFEYATWTKKKHALDKLRTKPQFETVADPKLARVWVANLLALRYREKLFRAAQILRFPTLPRHEKQKAAQRLTSTLERRLRGSFQLTFNRILKSSSDISSRFARFFGLLDQKVGESARKALFSLAAGDRNSGVEAARLAAVGAIARKIESFQANLDKRQLLPALVKLGALLDPESPTGARFHSKVYTVDLAMEKRLKLEAEAHPKILAKINAKAQAADIRGQIEKGKAELGLLHQRLGVVRESTRRLQLLRENEVRDLIARKNLGFSYEAELRQMLGDLWGPSKIQKGDQHSLSHLQEAGEHTNKTVILDQSVSKNVELEIEESSPHIMSGFKNARLAVESEFHPAPEYSKSQTTFKLNNSEKLLREMESKKLIKRLKELSLDGLMDHQGPAVEEVLATLASTKAELETALEKLASDFNDLQLKTVEEADRVDKVEAEIQGLQQRKVRFEMKLIDFQDKKGILTLERTTISQKNETIRREVEGIQAEISSLKAAAALGPVESQRLEKRRNDYFEKHELVQQNSSSLLRLDQELLELNRTISGMSQQGAVFQTQLRTLEEAKAESGARLATATHQLNELRADVRELLTQVAMNVSLIESLEMKKRRIGGSPSESHGDPSTVEVFSRFKDGFFRLNELRLQKAKLVSAQLEATRELADTQAVYEDLNQKIETLSKEVEPGAHGDLSELNLKRKQAAANQDRLARRLSSLNSEVRDVKRGIDGEAEKLREFMAEYEESPRKSSESSQVPDNRTDFLSKNSAYMSTKADFATNDLVEHSAIRENLLNLSKSSLADDNVKMVLVSKLNQESREALGITDQSALGTPAFDDALASVIAKKKAYLQNHQIAFFGFLKKEEIEDRIRGNSCEILDIKEQIAAREIAIRGLRRRLRGLGLKISEAESAGRGGRSRLATAGAPASLATTHTQTLLDDSLFGLRFTPDRVDLIPPRKKGVGWNVDAIVDTGLFPKKRERALQRLEPFVQKKKANVGTFDIDAKDLFDGRPEEMLVGANIKFDLNESGLKDSLVLDEFFPTDGFKKSVRKFHLRRQPESLLPPRISETVHTIHETNRKACPVDALVRPVPRKVIAISKSAKILTNDNFEDQKTKAVHLMAKVIPAAIRNAANRHFFHLRLVSSNRRLQSQMGVLGRFRTDLLLGKLQQVKNRLRSHAALVLGESTHRLVFDRKRQAFQRMQAKLNEVNRYRNWLLSKWMAKGDTTMRKHLRLVLQYWKHIRNDNLWNAKILKTMAVKAPLTTQIALWRLMLFRRRQYDCHPKLVKGLLGLITLVDSKQLMRGLRAIQGQERPRNDFEVPIVPERPKRTDPSLFQSELVAKEAVDEDFGIKSQRLYSLFTYMGIIQKRAKMQIFYKFLEQVKAEPVHRKLLRFEPKALEPTDGSDSGVRAVKFLLDQQNRSRLELANKKIKIQNLQDELEEKNENLLFMQAFLLNQALRRTERAISRVFARNSTLAAQNFFQALRIPKKNTNRVRFAN